MKTNSNHSSNNKNRISSTSIDSISQGSTQQDQESIQATMIRYRPSMWAHKSSLSISKPMMLIWWSISPNSNKMEESVLATYSNPHGCAVILRILKLFRISKNPSFKSTLTSFLARTSRDPTNKTSPISSIPSLKSTSRASNQTSNPTPWAPPRLSKTTGSIRNLISSTMHS